MTVPSDNEAPLVAAVDLGSNSFHLLIGRFVKNELQVIDRVREPVCLAQGLDRDNVLSPEAEARAVEALERMGQRLRSLDPGNVRAVGTNTLRSAANAARIRESFARALGHPIDVVAGREEARLIHLGVISSRFTPVPQLVVDIGGGSTEIILGEGYEILRAHSLFMGCVTFSTRFFGDGVLTKERFRAAELAARLELRSIEHDLREIGWDGAVGASGTIHAAHDIVVGNGWSGTAIDRVGLKRLRRAMIDAGSVDALALTGLKRDRAPVFAGGVAILRAIFKSLELKAMDVSSGAMREGVLHDLIGRIRHEDMRDRSVARMAERNHVDAAQAARVERTAVKLLRQVDWKGAFDAETARRQLVWAARLHEIGLAVSHTGFHKHGAYLLTHSDMPGFSSNEQVGLATLVRTQRRKLIPALFDPVPEPYRVSIQRLAILLRLAIVLNRGREPQPTPAVEIDSDWTACRLRFPRGWLRANPLSRADLAQEADHLAALGVTLEILEARRRAAREAPPAAT